MLIGFSYFSAAPSLSAAQFIGLAIGAYLIGSVADRLGALLDYAVDPIVKTKLVRSRAHRTTAREREAAACRRQLMAICVPSVPLDRNMPASDRSFWWDHLRLNCTPAIQELDRIEAVQKLFRSLTAVFLVVAVAYAWRPRLGPELLGRGGPGPFLWMLLFALLSAILYGIGRFAFRSAVFRLGVAYWIQQRACPPK